MIRAGEASRRALLEAGDRPVLLDVGGRVARGRELVDRVDRIAGALAERGLARRRVGLWYWNSLAAFEASLAIEWVGGTRVPVDPEATPGEARAVFAAAEVDAVLVDGAHAEPLGPSDLMHDDEAPLEGSAAWPGLEVEADRTLLLYPRMVARGELYGIPISYGNWEATMAVNQLLYRSGRYGPGFGDDECFMTVQQLMHGTGLLGSFPFLRMGLPQVVVRRFDAQAALEAMGRHRVTATFFVPGMVTRLVEAMKEADGRRVPSLRRVLYGGAPFAVGEMRDALRTLGPVLVQVYGRLEGGWPIAVLGIEEHRAALAGDDELGTSCGRPIREVEVRLRQVEGLPQGQGELCVRNAMVVAEFADAGGWCSLGDIARFDDRGYLHLEGRLDGMINTGAYHVYPAEVEEAILSVPGVGAARVLGRPDPVWGQAVTAYVVPAEGEQDEALLGRIREALAARLAKYKVPKAFHIVERLPEG